MIGQILALNLEGTLIDNVGGCNPRPGLKEFLESMLHRFNRVVLYTAVPEEQARDALIALAEGGHIPVKAAQIPIVNWPVGGAYYPEEGYGDGNKKDLRYVQDMFPDTELGEIFLVDDDEDWVNPDQHDQWARIDRWDGDPEDKALGAISELLWGINAGRPRSLPVVKPRVESAPLRFGDDWPGFYLRGDSANHVMNQWKLLSKQIDDEYPNIKNDPLVAIPMSILNGFFKDLERSHISHWQSPQFSSKPSK